MRPSKSPHFKGCYEGLVGSCENNQVVKLITWLCSILPPFNQLTAHYACNDPSGRLKGCEATREVETTEFGRFQNGFDRQRSPS